MPTSTDTLMRFGRFEIDPAERVLRIDGQNAVVGARAFDLLLALAERRGQLVSKQELLDIVWPGVVVEEHNIAAQMSTLRKLLGPDVIATVPGRGYRFIARANLESAAEPAAIREQRAKTAVDLTPIVGRADDLTAIAGLLTRHRLVTLIGAGGMGKTLLARHALAAAAAHYAQGGCWVDLASVIGGAEIPQRVAEALELRLPQGDVIAALAVAVAPLRVLITLDNAEHLVADVARVVAALIDAAPGVTVLITSQVPLRLAAEQLYRVGPLAVPDGPLPAVLAQTFAAVALFVERARNADSRFTLADADAPAVIKLCRALDGMPLAIELAAARAPLLGVRSLAASMHDRLSLLTRNRDATAPARQQTLRAALEWSHERLDERERIVFRRMGVMADSASLDFIRLVVADDALDQWAVLDALGELVDRSLVIVLPDDRAEPRYRLLDSPRALALERLRAASEEAPLRRRHATVLAAMFDAEWYERWSGSIGVLPWARRTMRDANHARDAIAWSRSAGEPGLTVQLAATLGLALPSWSHNEAMALADLCEALAERVESPALRLRALDAAVRPMTHLRQQRSLMLADEALALARELDRKEPDRWRLCKALYGWIGSASVIDQPPCDALRTALNELDAIEDSSWPPQRLHVGWNARRWAHLTLHPHDEYDEQLRLTRRWIAEVEAAQADVWRCLGSLIDAEILCGHVNEAVSIGERALEQLAGTRDEWSRMMVGANLALGLLALDDTVRVRPLLRQVWPAALRFEMHTLCADYPALLAALEHRPHTAARLAGYADAAYGSRALIRYPNELVVRRRIETLARAELGDATFDRLLAEGRLLRDEQIEALAFACEDMSR